MRAHKLLYYQMLQLQVCLGIPYQDSLEFVFFDVNVTDPSI